MRFQYAAALGPVVGWAAALAAAGLTPAAAAGGYGFAPVADNTGPFAGPLEFSLNDVGGLVVRWITDVSEYSIDVYGTGARHVADNAGSSGQTPYFIVGDPAINNAGHVTFGAVPYSVLRNQVQLDRGGAKSLVHDYAGADTGPGGRARINDAGLVAFNEISEYSASNPKGAVRLSDGRTLAREGAGGFTAVGAPTINNAGRVAFGGTRDGHAGVYVADGTTITTVANTAGPLASVSALELSMNDRGQIPVVASLDAGGEVLYVASPGTNGAYALAPAADTAGPIEDFTGSASINAAGRVAFNAWADGSSATGVYLTSAGGTPEPVVGPGDPLFGSTVTSASVLADSLNDGGHLAFAYRLASGVRGVAVAHPLSLTGDANLDGRVDVADLGLLATHYGTTPGPGGWFRGDFNHDGVINVADLGLLATYYGAGTTATSATSFAQDLTSFRALTADAGAVPEPAATSLLAAAAAGLLARRRRRAT